MIIQGIESSEVLTLQAFEPEPETVADDDVDFPEVGVDKRIAGYGEIQGYRNQINWFMCVYIYIYI